MKISNFKFQIFILLGYLFIGLLVVFPAKASASALSLGVYPPLIRIETLPPASVTAPITIKNMGEDSVNLKILFKPFTASSFENGTIKYLGNDYNPPDPLIFQKIQIFGNDHRVEEISLAPSQEKTLTLHVGVLKDDPLSDYYFSIIFSNTPEPAEGSNLSAISGGIAINVLLSIGPKEKPKGFIEEFSSPLFLQKGAVPFTVRIKNESQRVINPQGAILIKNMFGQTIGKVELLPVNILAGSIRAIPDSFQSPASPEGGQGGPEATPPANFKFQISNFKFQKAFWHESFLLGFYTARLTVALSDEGPVYSQTVHFFAMPIQAIIAFVMAIVITVFIIARVKKRLIGTKKAGT